MLAKLFISLVRISPSFQKAVWKWWYQILGKRGHDIGWTFMNYGFRPDDKELSPNLKPQDESNRIFIQLYDYAASQIPLDGLKVLEVGSGRGGGASFIARYYKPSSMTGLDYSLSAVKLSKSLHGEVSNLDFVEGDAENLPFEDNTFDAVVNVESSHCYGNMKSFISEVHRVLKVGGHFSWVDLRGKDMVNDTESIFTDSKLKSIHEKDITKQVVNALDEIHDQKTELISIHVPKIIQGAFKDFAGVKDSQIYNAFKNGNSVYLSKAFQKI